jgi:RNase P/RNase MRP subunit p29
MSENEYNEFNSLMGKILRIDSEHHKLPIFGRLVGISPQFLSIERKDGRLTLIKRKAILAIEATRNQQDSEAM